jgi:hypothetical protein
MNAFAVGLLVWSGATLLLTGAWFGGRSLATRWFCVPRTVREGESAASRWSYIAYWMGPLTAYLACSAVFFVTAMTFGATFSTLIVNIRPGGGAEHAGMISGDRIVAVDGDPVHSWDEALAALKSKPAQSVRVTIERDSEETIIVATTDARGRLGLESQWEHRDASLGYALTYALTHPARMLEDLVVGLSGWLIGTQPIQTAGMTDVGREISRARQWVLACRCLG